MSLVIHLVFQKYFPVRDIFIYLGVIFTDFFVNPIVAAAM